MSPDPSGWKPSPTVPRRILVVDDNPGSTQIMALLLRKFWGHTVEVAHDGHAALRVAEQVTPEIVLLDIGLPGLDGYEVATRLRAAPATSGALLVALTGFSSDGDRRKAHDAGFDEHLTKPAGAAELERLFSHSRLA
ncbi:MAG: hypothetical protein C0483_00645 [Pirellula sp.]|nr:hypothetical protein [Pirellula sp.]